MAVWQLTIGGGLVLDSSRPQVGPADVALESLTRSYDAPTELVVSTQAGTRWPADAITRLTADGQTVFVGLLDLPSLTHGARDGGRTTYRAYDRARLMLGRTSVNAAGETSGSTLYGDLEDVAQAYLTAVAAQCTGAGVAASARYVAGAGGVACYPISIDGESVDAVLRRLAAAAPGVRVHMSAGESQYAFVRVRATPVVELDVTGMTECAITHSLEGCCGAVQTSARTVSVSGSATVTLALAGDWSQAEQAAWTISQAGDSPVFRRWSYAASSIGAAAVPNQQSVMWIEVSVDGEWRRADAISAGQVDFVTKRVITANPLVAGFVPRVAARRNPNIPGFAVPATARLVFTQSGAGTVPVPVARYPAAGFGGRAYALAPQSMGFARVIDVPALPDGASFRADGWVRAMHDVLSEPVTRGTLTMAGDPSAALCGLERRISLVGPRRTGYEEMAAPLMSIEIDFPGRTYTLGFDTREPALMGVA